MIDYKKKYFKYKIKYLNAKKLTGGTEPSFLKQNDDDNSGLIEITLKTNDEEIQIDIDPNIALIENLEFSKYCNYSLYLGSESIDCNHTASDLGIEDRAIINVIENDYKIRTFTYKHKNINTDINIERLVKAYSEELSIDEDVDEPIFIEENIIYKENTSIYNTIREKLNSIDANEIYYYFVQDAKEDNKYTYIIRVLQEEEEKEEESNSFSETEQQMINESKQKWAEQTYSWLYNESTILADARKQSSDFKDGGGITKFTTISEIIGENIDEEEKNRKLSNLTFFVRRE
tara:strand:- start:666 stop:1535 length:870 start_codon:yes stop_codon:yes gene_type:complete